MSDFALGCTGACPGSGELPLLDREQGWYGWLCKGRRRGWMIRASMRVPVFFLQCRTRPLGGLVQHTHADYGPFLFNLGRRGLRRLDEREKPCPASS